MGDGEWREVEMMGKAATWRSTQISVKSTQISESRSTVPRGLPFDKLRVDFTLICVKFSKI